MNRISNAIKKIRGDLSYRKLAEKVSVPYSVLYEMETKNRSASITVILKITNSLGDLEARRSFLKDLGFKI